jgi:hypothetical protein
MEHIISMTVSIGTFANTRLIEMAQAEENRLVLNRAPAKSSGPCDRERL